MPAMYPMQMEPDAHPMQPMDTLMRPVEQMQTMQTVQAMQTMQTVQTMQTMQTMQHVQFVQVWAAHKKYKYHQISSNIIDISYLYFRFVLGCIDADLCK